MATALDCFLSCFASVAACFLKLVLFNCEL